MVLDKLHLESLGEKQEGYAGRIRISENSVHCAGISHTTGGHQGTAASMKQRSIKTTLAYINASSNNTLFLKWEIQDDVNLEDIKA